MTSLGDQLRRQAHISARPGQHDTLYELAEEADHLTNEVEHLWALLAKRRAQQHEVDRLTTENEKLQAIVDEWRAFCAALDEPDNAARPSGCVDCDHIWLSHRFASHGGGCGVPGCVCTEPCPDQEAKP